MNARHVETEVDCYLEIEGASPSHAEAVSEALAEEIEAWMEDGRALDPEEASIAESLIRELRVIGWLVSTDRTRSTGELMSKLELLVTKANELLLPPAERSHRRLTPPAGVDLSKYLDFDDSDEGTIVKRSTWDRTHTTNRALNGPKSTPPKSQR